MDLVIPDITYLQGKEDRIRGIFITHGHEDHIGAIPYICPQIPAPIYATRLTLGLIRSSCSEHRLMQHGRPARGARPATGWTSARSSVEFFHVCHSIPDACGLGIHTPAGHDHPYRRLQVRPDAGGRAAHRLFDADPAWAMRACCCLLSATASTSRRRGITPSEREVARTLDQLLRRRAGPGDHRHLRLADHPRAADPRHRL